MSDRQERQTVAAEASRWVVRLNAGRLSRADGAAFRRWLNQSDLHRQEFTECAALWGLAGEICDAYLPARETEVSFKAMVGAWFQANPRRAMAAAFAAVALLLLVAVPLLSRPGVETNLAYATAVGEQRTVRLSDGSQVQLNTQSGIETAFAENERAVSLLAGEAHFDVVSNAERPFRVYAGGSIVEVVGTAFVVSVHQGPVEVTVTEGTVKVFNERNEEAPEAADTVITAGQKLTHAEAGVSVERMDEEELVKELAWQSGMLLFDGDRLEDVVAEFARYTPVTFEIADADIRDTRIVGYFDAGDTKRFLSSLETAFGITVNDSLPGVVVLSKQPS